MYYLQEKEIIFFKKDTIKKFKLWINLVRSAMKYVMSR
jgi:hypothetical protein